MSAQSDEQSVNSQMQRENKDEMVVVAEDYCNKRVVENVKAESTTSSMAYIVPSSGSRVTIPESTSDFKDWLEGIKMVARLPGGMPVEFRRKLWLALAERYLKRRGVDWDIEKVKWFSENWRADDEELGIQIVKDLHRTGHSLLSGPTGELNQAKLKRILMGFTRWNPEVGYCQGFNMLGAIILQVMDKSEVDSIKVLIFLIEGLLPAGYFCGSLMGLQVDMAVFRELLGKKMPKLARHLHKLQYQANSEPTSVEPPLINVFTMQWFLTLFCNCLPMTSVLRIWDLIMTEGSDVLLRTALSIWKLLEDKILREVRTADDFYCKMEPLMTEFSKDQTIDSNVMVQMISDLGPITDLQKLRQKHLTASYNDQKQLKMMYSKAEGDTERLAVANAWQNNRVRRGSQQLQSDREKIALDITILRKQYDKLRERQKQAHIILTSAVSKQNQQEQTTPMTAATTNVNKLLAGKHAIISKGRKGPPKGAIPPARKMVNAQKTSLSSTMVEKKTAVMKELDMLHGKNTDESNRRKNSLTWKEINAELPTKTRSDSSSYSENSDSESSPSTSLCDDENLKSLDTTPVKKKRHKDIKKREVVGESNSAKSASSQSHFNLMTPLTVVDEVKSTSNDSVPTDDDKEPQATLENVNLSVPHSEIISSISQLSPMPDISSYFSTAISPIKLPSNYYDFPDLSSFSNAPVIQAPEKEEENKFEVSEQGVTNEFFERVTSSNVFNLLPSSSSSRDNSFIKLKHVNQKSLSMEEESLDVKEKLCRINRSFSDGTIIYNDAGDIFQKIIAENTKILTKFSNESLSSSTRTPIVETILEETKSSEDNSSECEEIAAIDVAEECTSTMDDGIQDIADIPFESQNSNYSSYIDIKPSATLSMLACNAEFNDDDVILQNEKSMNGKNSEDEMLATLHTTCNTSRTLDSKVLAQRSLPLKDVDVKSEKVISPKFNEISALVDKLKRDMESELKKDEKIDSVENNAAENDITKKESVDEVAAEINVKEKVSVKITINCVDEKPIEAKKNIENHVIDLEKQEKKIDDKIESDSVQKKLNTQLDETHRIEVTVAATSNEKINSLNEYEVSPAKDSSVILKKLNAQLQRYEEPINSRKQHRSPSAERMNDYKKELDALLKERDPEKMSKSATYRYDESPQPLTVNSSSTSALYDHEPRNDIRRRDIASLESQQQTRRPFKSSPSSSLSSSPSNINSTLSSIQNTIKSLDSACQRSEIYNYKKLDKAMESIEKICESDREWHFYKFTKKLESPPMSNTKSQRIYKDLSSLRSNFSRFEAENIPKSKTPELDPNYLAKLRCLSTEDYIAGRKSPMSLSPNRERNTLDRYSRIDRSPTSPSISSRFLKSPTGDRASKSAENSPSRYGGESTLSTRYSQYSPSNGNTYSSDMRAESMNNLSCKSVTCIDLHKKYYEFEWEKTSTRIKYDI